jgi:eukaryotic-like serine/threonine-protein kinase
VTFSDYPSFREPNSARQSPVRPGQEVMGKYRVDRVLGSGAMGVVVLAWHIELEQKVAIKFLHAELAQHADGAERFRREARAVVRIRNEHVARVLDVGTLEGQGIPFIVMEYLHGRDLACELGARGSLPVSEAARYLVEACQALGEAHARGIVHRDLKPANLFLAERPSGGQMIKVLDFGISKTIGGNTLGLSITDAATLMGSPGYMSPEQLESSRSVDARSDIWSLGVILYEMVTGVLPFGGDSVPRLIRSIIAGDRAPLSDRDGAVADLEPIVARCLQQDRADRYPSVSQLCDDLEPFARSVTGSPYRIGGTMSREEPLRSTPPPVGVSPDAATVRPGSPQEGAWGRTHAGRRATLRLGVPLVASLCVVGAIALWRARGTEADPVALPSVAAREGVGEPRREVEVIAAPLEPTRPQVPSPAPAVVGAPPEPTTPAGSITVAPREPAAAAGPGAPAAPVAREPAAPAAATPSVAPRAPLPVPAKAPAASGLPGSLATAPGHSAPAPIVLPSAPLPKPRDGEVGAPDFAGTRNNPYEIPEFGGRK